MIGHLLSYVAWLKAFGAFDMHEYGRWLNNRADNSHQRFRRRDRTIFRFQWMKSLHKCAAIHGSPHNASTEEAHFALGKGSSADAPLLLSAWCLVLNLRPVHLRLGHIASRVPVKCGDSSRVTEERQAATGHAEDYRNSVRLAPTGATLLAEAAVNWAYVTGSAWNNGTPLKMRSRLTATAPTTGRRV